MLPGELEGYFAGLMYVSRSLLNIIGGTELICSFIFYCCSGQK